MTSPKDVLFLDKEDVDLKIKHFPAVIYHKVIFHELLGHGCGKLFYEGNYDSENIINPLTSKNLWFKHENIKLKLLKNLPEYTSHYLLKKRTKIIYFLLTDEKGIKKCYKPNDTWNSVFKNLSNPYEECRADSVALYFSTFKEAYEVL